MLATVAGMRQILLAQTRQVDECLHLLNEDERGDASLLAGEPDVNRVVKALMHMVGISAHSLVKLTDEVSLGAKDGYPLARAIIEGAVNASFLMASDPEIARKAQRHAEVRAFRDLSRKSEMGGWSFDIGHPVNIPSIEAQRMELMAAEFTTAKGRDKDWTDLSLRQRIDATAAAFPSTALLSLSTSAINIYRHASEVMHGSYYGALMIWGMTTPRPKPLNRDTFRLVFVDHQFTTLSSAIFAFAGMVECFAIYANVPHLKVAVNEAIDALSKLPAVEDALGQSS